MKNMKYILKPSEFKEGFAFVIDKGKEKKYHCDCGHTFTSEMDDESLVDELNKTSSHIDDTFGDEEEILGEFKLIHQGVENSMVGSIICPNCNKNYRKQENLERVVSIGMYFISGYKLKDTETELCLFFSKVKPVKTEEEELDFFEDYKFIKFNKETRSLYYKPFGGQEHEFDLDEVTKILKLFFQHDTKKIINAIDIHLFIGNLAKYVVDSNNINIINELLDNIRNRPNEIGESYINKIIAIFFGVIKYSNLSTIAMTKGSVFLYDLMLECDIPKPKELIESQATSPIKIFNFLIKNYIRKINEDVNADNKSMHDFVFKSDKTIEGDEDSVEVKLLDEEKDMNIKVKNVDNYNTGKLIKTKDGRYEVMSLVEDGAVSSFIYKKIDKFSDYKQLIKFLKIVNKNQLIDLLQKYEKDFLVNVIDLLYFRSQVEFEELKRMLDIIHDFTDVKSKERWDFSGEKFTINYSYTHEFQFIEYDDSLMMMEVLEFDPKRHFTKIRKYKDLIEYHNNLIKFFKVLEDEKKNGSIQTFVSKFRFLEERGDYDGPIHVKLLATPGLIIREGMDMRHSASAYARNVAQGTYLMGSVYDKDPNRPSEEMERYTIGFTFDKYNGLEFDQVKGFANQLGSNRFRKLIIDWLKVKEVSFRMVNDIKLIDYDMNEGEVKLLEDKKNNDEETQEGTEA